MSSILIAICGIIYAGVAVDQAIRGNWPMCVVYVGYALANVGLYVMAR